MSFRRSDLVGSRVKVALRNESYSWVLESQDFAKVQSSGSHENQEKAVSWETMLFEVEFFSYSGNFCLRACVCPREMLSSFSLRPHDYSLVIT